MRRCLPVRGGLTLYEVVLSLMILLGSMNVLADLIAAGSRAAVQSRLRTEAALRCQTKLSEVIAGIEPMQAVDGALIDPAAPVWVWSLQIQPGPHPDLFELEVTVSHLTKNNTADMSVSFHRYLRNPELFEQAALQEAGSENTVESSE